MVAVYINALCNDSSVTDVVGVVAGQYYDYKGPLNK